MKEQQVDVNGIRLQVREYEHEGETIIFLHYGSGNLMMWQGVVPYFQDTYRLALIDLRGHGKSDSPQDGYHIDQMATDVAGVIEYLGLTGAHVVGSSLGAEVGLSLAANYPDKVVSLVCEGALYSEYGPYGSGTRRRRHSGKRSRASWPRSERRPRRYTRPLRSW
jgi:pimeloyl-ACP methyl ester carboxylesterase